MERVAGLVDLHVRGAAGGGIGVPRRGREAGAYCRVRESVCSAPVPLIMVGLACFSLCGCASS